MIQVFMCLLVLGPSIYSVTEGCGRVPATPAPTTVPTPTEPTINGSLRGLQCRPEEVNKTSCLNEGTCFVLVIEGERKASCHCTYEYEGVRCQDLNIEVIIPRSTERDQFAKAGIAASIAVLIVIVIVFVGVTLVYYRRRRRERMGKKPRGGVNGSLLPENNIQPPNPNMHQYARNGLSNNCNSFEEKKPLQIQYQITSV